MKEIYLLDTNIISEVTKPFPSQNVLTNLEFYQMSCAISSITWFELLKEVTLLKDEKRKDDLYSFLIDYVKPSFNIIPYDEHAAFINSTITQKLIPAGFPTPILDTQIASIAIANNLILVTKNTKDFQIFLCPCYCSIENSMCYLFGIAIWYNNFN